MSKRMQSGIFGWMVAVATVAAVSIPGDAHSESSKELVAAAKKEGQLVLYTAMQRKVIDKSVELFQQKYGIQVNFTRRGSGGIISLIEAERETKTYRADVVDLWDPPTFRAWKSDGLFLSYKPAGADKLRQDLVDPDWEIVTPSPVTIVIAYNSRLVPADQAPKSFEELADPKWRDKLVHADPIYSGSTTAAVNILTNMHGWGFYEKLAANRPLIVQSIGATPRMLLTGEAEVAVVAIDADTRDHMVRGEPLEVVYPTEGVPFFTWDSAILKTATNVNAAKLWQDFLISEEHQRLLTKEFYYPARTDVEAAPESPPLKTLKLLRVDTEYLQKHKAEQNEKFHEIMRDAPTAK